MASPELPPVVPSMVLFSDRGVDLASKLSRLSMDANGGPRFQRSAKEEVILSEALVGLYDYCKDPGIGYVLVELGGGGGRRGLAFPAQRSARKAASFFDLCRSQPQQENEKRGSNHEIRLEEKTSQVEKSNDRNHY